MNQRTTAAFILIGSLLLLGARLVSDDHSSIVIGGSTIDVSLVDDDLKPKQDELLTWVRNATQAIEAYYGQFPLKETSVNIHSFDGSGVRAGRTFGRTDSGFIRISVGTETTAAELHKDWMMTHEMVHLTFPSVPEQHHWIEEGLAVYVEPIARMRSGNMTPEVAWGEMVRDMPQGQPQPGAEGLDHTDTWANTYWGGALFSFVADVEIRKRTHNQKGLEDALRAILNAGGNITQDWELRHVFEVGDKAVGVPVLEELYDKMKDKPVTVDLDGMWKQLGVSRQNGVTTFNDHAPLAAIREAITTGKAPGKR